MAFTDELNARYGDQNIIRLSNLNSTSTATVNATVIAGVLVDVGGWFKTYAGVAYDDTDARMIGIACDVGVLLLRRRAGEHGDFTALWTDLKERALALRKVTHSDTVVAEKQLMNMIPEQATDRSFFSQATMYNKGFPTLLPSVSDQYYSMDYP